MPVFVFFQDTSCFISLVVDERPLWHADIRLISKDKHPSDPFQTLICHNTEDMNSHIHPEWKEFWQGQCTEDSFPNISILPSNVCVSMASTAQVRLSACRQIERVIRWDGPSKLDQGRLWSEHGLSTRKGNSVTTVTEESVTFGTFKGGKSTRIEVPECRNTLFLGFKSYRNVTQGKVLPSKYT